jgi:hypothetical protein
MPLGPFTKKKKRKNAFFLFFTHNATNASKEQIEACEKKIDRINNKKRENTYKHGGGEQNGCEKKHRCGAFLVWFFFFFFFFFFRFAFFLALTNREPSQSLAFTFGIFYSK